MADDKIPIGTEKTPQTGQETPQTAENNTAQPQGGKRNGPRRVFRSNKTKGKTKRIVYPDTPISDEALERLAQLMNDSPTILKLKGTEWRIKALRPGTQWMIAEEACKIARQDKMTMGDIIKQFAVNMPAVCRCLTLALLNDKQRIEGKEYQRVYDTLMWGEYDMRDWATLLFEVINLIDVNFFFASTNAILTVRGILQRKTTGMERKLFRPEQSGDR